jgi:hypothetical protein
MWLYSPIFGLGRLHETFRFTRSRTISRPPWTGDQLVARPLLPATGDCVDDDGEVGSMNGFGRGNRSTRRKPALAPLCPPQIPICQTQAWTQATVVGSQRLTASAMARPMRGKILHPIHSYPALVLRISYSTGSTVCHDDIEREMVLHQQTLRNTAMEYISVACLVQNQIIRNM